MKLKKTNSINVININIGFYKLITIRYYANSRNQLNISNSLNHHVKKVFKYVSLNHAYCIIKEYLIILLLLRNNYSVNVTFTYKI